MRPHRSRHLDQVGSFSDSSFSVVGSRGRQCPCKDAVGLLTVYPCFICRLPAYPCATNPLAQAAHLTGSIKLLPRPIRSASALSWRFQFGGSALRFCASFLPSLVVVSSFSFPSFPSVLCSCLLLLFLFVSLVCLSVGVSVCWCVASLGWVPFRSVPLLCLLPASPK